MSQIRKEIKTLNKEIISVLIITFMFAMLFGVVKMGMAVNNVAVNCNVSGKLISLNVINGQVDYGVLAADENQNTTTDGTSDTQNVINNGTITEDFLIKSSDAAGTTAWNLSNAKATDNYIHSAAIDSSNSFGVNMVDDTTYYALKSAVAKDAVFNLDLQIGMPTTITDYEAHTITVTVMASE